MHLILPLISIVLLSMLYVIGEWIVRFLLWAPIAKNLVIGGNLAWINVIAILLGAFISFWLSKQVGKLSFKYITSTKKEEASSKIPLYFGIFFYVAIFVLSLFHLLKFGFPVECCLLNEDLGKYEWTFISGWVLVVGWIIELLIIAAGIATGFNSSLKKAFFCNNCKIWSDKYVNIKLKSKIGEMPIDDVVKKITDEISNDNFSTLKSLEKETVCKKNSHFSVLVIYCDTCKDAKISVDFVSVKKGADGYDKDEKELIEKRTISEAELTSFIELASKK